MRVELFPFQEKAVKDLRLRAAGALRSYRDMHVPQVISLQAPTGSGKTIIMAAFIEAVYFGTENFEAQPDAIFVWLSDSPALNEQSKQKIDLKADKIRFGQCVTIDEASFDMEELEDGYIYFLNTQKLGKGGKLGQHGDTRQYTIWETLENTARNKSDRLYFVIDEAHRGMQGKAAGTATTIMQRFIKGSPAHRLSPMPVVLGMSATAARFNRLVGDDTTSTLQKVIISPNEVRASGLLKDRIIITYPDDPTRNNDMAVLQAAADEWKKKCEHWHEYCYTQHYAQVNPVFVVQVQAGKGKTVSGTNLDDVIEKIEERTGWTFAENEVVHTFGSTGALKINGLNVPHVEPDNITDDKRIRVVLFKENLSTGWDCPRAETMMSFRKAEDATYIAQLLGRMVRTPLQSHILVDDYLNDVRLYLPYFDKATVKSVIDELQNSEGGEIPADIDSESLENAVYDSWSIHPKLRTHKQETPIDGQLNMDEVVPEVEPQVQPTESVPASDKGTEPSCHLEQTSTSENLRQPSPQKEPLPIISKHNWPVYEDNNPQPTAEQISFAPEIDRAAVTKFINELGLLTYDIKTVRIHDYLKSLLDLATLLMMEGIYPQAKSEFFADVVAMMRSYVDELHSSGQYDALAAKVLQFKLSVDVYDVFGESIKNYGFDDFITTSDADLDRQLQNADAKMAGGGFCNKYGQKYADPMNPRAYAIDCILFAANDDCIDKLKHYAEKKFNEYVDNYRRAVVGKSEKCKKAYDKIVSNSGFVTQHNFTLPEEFEPRIDPTGKKYYNHLFVNDDGFAQIKFDSSWEEDLIEEESEQPGFVCWLRNMPLKSWSLCLPYKMDGEYKSFYPDFLIVRADAQTKYVVDVLEPHMPSNKDNLAKAKALAEYAEKEPRIGRVQLIRMVKDTLGKSRLKRLDMSYRSTRQKVLGLINNDELDKLFVTDGKFCNTTKTSV